MDASFTSLRFPFAIDPGLKRVAREEDYSEHVKQLVIQVLLTAPGERINRPDFGCGVKRLVFAPNGTVAATLAQTTIFQALRKWLAGVIEVNEVSVTPIGETLEIRVGYVVRARGEKRYLNLEIAP
jgi:hypothetical protein